ncbi:MAG: hypothetical protein IT285_15290 [Bdellovibrionales bacterium]|nr:hypothetical protein [Bdellovibrionales bacterium]
MTSKTWVPEMLAAIYFGLLLASAGCSHEDISRNCRSHFPRPEESRACIVGATIAGEKGNLIDADKACRDCYVGGSHCPYLDGGVSLPAPGASLEQYAEHAATNSDQYAACYQGAAARLEYDR